MRIGGELFFGEIVRAAVLARAEEDAHLMLRAHCICAERMERAERGKTVRWRLAILRHLIEALKYTKSLFGFFGESMADFEEHLKEFLTTASIHETAQAAEILLHHNEVCGVIDAEISVEIAVALAFGSQTDLAEALMPVDPVDDVALEMRRQAALSEICKNRQAEADKTEEMRAHADAALRLAERLQAQEDIPKNRLAVLHYRHNRTRILQYFDHEYDRAICEYRDFISVIDGITEKTDGEAELEIAARRNLTDVFIDDPKHHADPETLDEAERIISRAIELADAHGFGRQAAELYYTRARLREVQERNAAAEADLQMAIRVGKEAGNLVACRIAEDRSFWNGVRREPRQFDRHRAGRNRRYLDYADWHAWALRVSIKNRLLTAKFILDGQGDAGRGDAATLLNEALTRSTTNPGLRGYADRRRTILSYAGLSIIERDKGDAWCVDMSAAAWASEWLRAEHRPTPRAIWGTL
jgi:hypothetical protein